MRLYARADLKLGGRFQLALQQYTRRYVRVVNYTLICIRASIESYTCIRELEAWMYASKYWFSTYVRMRVRVMSNTYMCVCASLYKIHVRRELVARMYVSK